MKPVLSIWKLDDQKASVLLDQLYDRIERLEKELDELKREKQPVRMIGHKHGVFEQFYRTQIEMTKSQVL
ncbi:hypothetical protein [Paenibacillus abyssi]|uniref:Uncharacterized protein n=1 Tax=Paenibacillus abyssi TaxID=1340531 RepID=A0A917CXZ6_9BACL|nr:hypothetical protein [Paenibacillus abyssi]GGG00612.1 hypothetical protein GCM10010916_17200 [Paenibacillus abyssi]